MGKAYCTIQLLYLHSVTVTLMTRVNPNSCKDDFYEVKTDGRRETNKGFMDVN